jgi:CRP-like cAMP-binding protein/uncharacterized membrane protein YdbT with pleckstrin-like domain
MNSPEMIRRLKRIARLSGLPDDVLADLARVVTAERHPPGTEICQEGEPGDILYAIEFGDVLVQNIVGDKKVTVAHLSNGDVFGERALAAALPRTADVIAETTVETLGLHREDYQQLVQKHPTLKRILVGPQVVPLLGQVPLFSSLSQEELTELAGHTGVLFYPPGRHVIEQGEMGTTMYVVIEGDLVAYRLDERGRTRPVKALKKGDAFGETSLLVGEPRDATVMTKTYAELCYLHKPSFDAFLEAHPNVQNRLQMRPEVQRKRTARPFPGQNEDEIVVIMDSKHWMAFLSAIAGPALWLALGAVALAVMNILWLGSAGETMGLSWLSTALTMLWVLAAVAVFAWHWVDWRNDSYIVTTQRIVHIERVLLRVQTTDVVPIRQVQNIDLEQDLLGEILDYGHIRVTTAGPAGGASMDLKYVDDPDAFQRTIFEQIGRAQYRAVVAERAELRRAIRHTMGFSVLEEEVEGEPPPGKKERSGWIVLLTQNRLAKRLRKTMTESGLATFLRHPHLPRQEIRQDDQVIWRKHWGIFLKVTYRPLLLCLAIFGLILLAVAGWLGSITLFDFPPSLFSTALLVLTVGFIPALGWLLWEVEDWRNDLYIVTNTHIIDIERVTPILLRETKRQASLDNIQNTQSSTKGFWANLLKLGDVIIETAGEGTFEFKQVRHPAKVQAEIDKRREAYRARQRQEQAERQRTDMAKWFSVYRDVMHEEEARAHWQARELPPPIWTEGSEEQDES